MHIHEAIALSSSGNGKNSRSQAALQCAWEACLDGTSETCQGGSQQEQLEKTEHLEKKYWRNSLRITAALDCAEWFWSVWECPAWWTGTTGAIQRAFLFSTETCWCAHPYLDLGGNKCWKPIPFLLEGMWKQHILKGFFSGQKKKKVVITILMMDCKISHWHCSRQ